MVNFLPLLHNPNCKYFIKGNRIVGANVIKDLGFTVNASLSFDERYGGSAARVDRMLFSFI